ncbi:amylo-alpha-1,6-glucosidase [Streptoalloteichus hindustanus]|uniref:Glycogen debranching enzyme (Alpha-1,6-glucosidase) n=1 Tax=Streptoalloteichus hindustanus TaxID=2017 RepID=A0A1M4YYK3_STRHI|nr:glycogen debranching N-terminal domain-containing protein [Streptoalloteichus hindustanus]SHF10894.1 Glycogen debranching enzyme (alpha-1,6-glucosidase) [Streptoalloteichus hindustanus]
MNTGWTFAGEPAAVGPGALTLVEGSTFCLSAQSGDVDPGGVLGLFVRDTRVLSRWQARIDSQALQPVTVLSHAPYGATFLSRMPPGPEGRALLLRRDRYVGNGLREDLELINLGTEEVRCELRFTMDCDFADLFEVKEGRVQSRGEPAISWESGAVEYASRGEHRLACRVSSSDFALDGADGERTPPVELRIPVQVPGRASWRGSVTVTVRVGEEELALDFPPDDTEERETPATRLARWVSGTTQITTNSPELARVLSRSRSDLAMLRIYNPELDSAVIAAGSPWFMTLFGRDSLLTAYQALPMDPSLAVGTLLTLAQHQGTKVEPVSEEEPGRILHEVRSGVDAEMTLGGAGVYYGSVDATPLFVMLVGELARWGLATDEVETLLPHVDRALEWVERYGDKDGDGFVEYQRATDRGLVNQGWKDSSAGLNFEDGTTAEPPIALVEVQGYVYAAYLARAYLARQRDDEPTAERFLDKASRLREEFNRRFWLEDRDYFAVALDADKRPVDGLASNMGHCLWTGIADPDKARRAARRLLEPDMFSGWGIRTLSAKMSAYNPMSYHNGSVWPHDNALAAAGLMRYGMVDEALKIICGILDAAAALDGHLPELFCGFDRDEFPGPVPYPTSCSPQAWSAAAPIHLMRLLLRFAPDVLNRRVWIDPVLPPRLTYLTVHQLRVAGGTVDIRIRRDGFEVTGLPEGFELVKAPSDLVDPLLAGRAAG